MTSAQAGQRRRPRLCPLSPAAAAVTATLLVLCLTPGGAKSWASGDMQGQTHGETDGQTPVRRLAGGSRVDTAVAAAQAGWDRADTAVLAAAAAFPDAVAGASLAARLDAPLLLTSAEVLSDPVATELVRLGAGRVLLVGGEAAIGSQVAAQVAALPGSPTVRRLAGRDRFDTAARAAVFGDPHEQHPGTVVIASGADFADAVSGGSLPHPGSTRRAAVLLATRDTLPQASVEALGALRPTRAVLVGGHAALGKAVEAALADHVGEVVRHSGRDRFATSGAVLVAALAHLGEEQRPLVLATGEAFPDALAAAALAARLDGLVLLVPRFRIPEVQDTLLREHAARFSELVVLGGATAIDHGVVEEVRAVLSGRPLPPVLHTVITPEGFRGIARPVPPEVQQEMIGVSWRPGCPVRLEDLALLALTHHDLADEQHTGELVVARDVAAEVIAVFARLHAEGVPISRMVRVDHYGGDDAASMQADNTSAFNCRPVTGGVAWSEHAYGTAVDINPVRNPYVRGQTVLPEAGRAFLDRGEVRPGMAVRPGPIVEAFEAAGWTWGGDFRTLRDYMHFSAGGR